MSESSSESPVPYATDTPSLTPFQALYEALRRTGWVDNKADFARLLRINEGNVYHYLANPTAHYRLSSKAGTIHAACWAIALTTDLRIQIRLDPSGTLDLEIRGKDIHGAVITSFAFKTLYHLPFTNVRTDEGYTCDFTVAQPWLSTWEEEWDLGPSPPKELESAPSE